jgi:hypothetical protein
MLTRAFVQVQQVGWRRMLHTGALAVMLPWLPAELEQIAAVMGPQHWKYGFVENYHVLDALC